MMISFNTPSFSLPRLNSLFATTSQTAFQSQWQQLQNQGLTKAQLQEEARTLQAQLGFVPPQLQQLINQFDTADTNKDGILSQQELATQVQTQQAKNPFAAFISQQGNAGVSNPFAYNANSGAGSFQLGQQGLTGISTLNATNRNNRYSASSDRLTNLISQFGNSGTATDEEGVSSSSLLY
ncbi:MAG: hypothetical protein NTW61_01180 [Candidatus Melainabacteria bacterium]|nr:hypothetical protein [Candidatus Melainabacteria bacterium]